MRYGILSDVHSNLEALRSVVSALAIERIDEYLFLGDLVGYGADPHACIVAMRLLRPRVTIAGNHDWGVLDLLGIDYFNEGAASAITWTRSQLNSEERDYLRSFPVVHENPAMTLVHGSLNKPMRFNYIHDIDEAYLCMQIAKTAISFLGHTHVPGIYSLYNGIVTVPKEKKVILEPGRKYLVNAGSVGQPRDGDPRASYVIYDDVKSTVEIKRVFYDITTAQEKIIKAGLPRRLSSRLGEGR